MNTLAILPQLLMRILQSHNVKHISFNKIKNNSEVSINVTQNNKLEQEESAELKELKESEELHLFSFKTPIIDAKK